MRTRLGRQGPHPRNRAPPQVREDPLEEERAGPGVQALVWLSPECLVTQPPLLFDLAGEHDAAVRPVHIKNVGLRVTDPVDGFWRRVYEAVGVEEPQAIVESFVEGERIRAYFNTHAVAVNPSRGLFRRWLDVFEALVRDRQSQAGACGDDLLDPDEVDDIEIREPIGSWLTALSTASSAPPPERR